MLACFLCKWKADAGKRSYPPSVYPPPHPPWLSSALVTSFVKLVASSKAVLLMEQSSAEVNFT